MLIAQGLAEYGALSGVASSLVGLIDRIENAVSNATPTTWVVVGAVVLAAWFLFRR